MSTDDIQKAKMRAIFMQSKYGKNGTSSNDNTPQKNEVPKIASASMTRITPPTSSPVHLKKVEDKKNVSPPSKASEALQENSMHLKLNMDTRELLLSKLKTDAIPWRSPPEVSINCLWRVGAGEKSKEVEVQLARIRREKETVYCSVHEIPSNPKEPWDVEMDFDDSLTPEIPTEQLPDDDAGEVAPPDNVCENKLEVSTDAPAGAESGNPEPDLELLAVLLKNPELVFALTSGQGSSFSSAEMVALLDRLKASGIGLPGVFGGPAVKVAEKEEVMTTLPSPTPPHERGLNWRSEPSPMSGLQEMLVALSQPVVSSVGRNGVSLPGPTPNKLESNGLVANQIPNTSSSVPSHITRTPLSQQLSVLNKADPASATIPLMQPIPVPSSQMYQTSVGHSHVNQLSGASPLLQSSVAPSSSLKQMSGLNTAHHQISTRQVPISGAMLKNQFHVPNFNQNSSVPTGTEVLNFGRTLNQKPPPMSALPNPTDRGSPTPSFPSSLSTPLRTQQTLLPEPRTTSFKSAISKNGSMIGRNVSASQPSSTMNSLYGISDGQSINYRLQANQSTYNAYRAGPGQPHSAYIDRNEFSGGADTEQWNLESGQFRSSGFRSERNYNEPRRDYDWSIRPEWPRHRDSDRWDHRSGSRRWKDNRRH